VALSACLSCCAVMCCAWRVCVDAKNWACFVSCRPQRCRRPWAWHRVYCCILYLVLTGVGAPPCRTAAEMERHRHQLADAAIEEQLEVQTAFREHGARLQGIYDKRQRAEYDMAKRWGGLVMCCCCCL
jgi:hypothetical protein